MSHHFLPWRGDAGGCGVLLICLVLRHLQAALFVERNYTNSKYFRLNLLMWRAGAFKGIKSKMPGPKPFAQNFTMECMNSSSKCSTVVEHEIMLANFFLQNQLL